MKLIIAGSRLFDDGEIFASAMAELVAGAEEPVTEVVCGCARGADKMGEAWGRQNRIPVKYFQAEWKQHGKSAGPMRNRAMAEYADRAIVFWDGESRGSRSVVDEMERLGKPVKVVLFDCEVPF